MESLFLFVAIATVVTVVLYITWNTFFQWYVRKREREAQQFLASLSNRGSPYK